MRLLATILVLGYSAVLFGAEWRMGDAANVYLQDPAEPALFGHVNTWLSATLLAGVALLCALAVRLETVAGGIARETGPFFPASQAVFFAFVALDERFRLLVGAAREIGAAEWTGYLALAGIEAALLLGPGRALAKPETWRWLAPAAACLGLSAVLDTQTGRAFSSHALEEVPKVWAGALLLGWAWARIDRGIDGLAFPRAAGSVFEWSRALGREEFAGREERRVAEGAAAPTPDRTPQPEMTKAPAQRAGAPEPNSKDESLVSSAAPPRKLLSH